MQDAQWRAQVMEAAIKLISIFFFFAGLQYAIAGAEYSCGSLNVFILSVAADLSDEHAALLDPTTLEAIRSVEPMRSDEPMDPAM